MKSDITQTIVAVFIVLGLGFVLRGCYDNAVHPLVIGTTTVHRADTTVKDRVDSQKIKVSLILPPAKVHGRANKRIGTDTDLTVALDTIGFFGKDTLQVTPDTAKIAYNLYKNEFALEYYFGSRIKDVLIKYITKDSVITNTNTVTNTQYIPSAWYEKPLFVLSGAIIVILVKALFHL